jgi:hypothetical protein
MHFFTSNVLWAKEHIPTPFSNFFTFKFTFEFYEEFEGVSLEIGTLATLKAHDLLCRPLIKMNSKRKVVALVEIFWMICGMSLTHM